MSVMSLMHICQGLWDVCDVTDVINPTDVKV